MSEASLAAQQLAVGAMRASAGVLALVPSQNIFDRAGRPERFPCIILGEATTTGEDIECADLSDVSLTIHAWTDEATMSGVKEIAGAVRRALRRLEGTRDGFVCDFAFADSIFLRDPSGTHSHAVISFDVSVEDTAEIA